MIIELHAIQSFAPANLNRDDSGAPKECTFGGARRARVSSQSWKRAMRMAFRESGTAIELGTRTKRAHEKLADRIAELDPALPPGAAAHRAAAVLEGEPLNLSLKGGDGDAAVKTGQLIFFRDADLDTLARAAVEFAEDLDAVTTTLSPTNDPSTKKKSKAKVPKELTARVKTAMTSPGRALDVALFGRLMAEMPEANVDAACQVAHAIGTHRLSSEFDYYTAVDDLKPDDTGGADMIGYVQFNASCLYRYAVVDVRQLAANLGVAADDRHLAAALATFTRAFVLAIPSGKQATFAARNPPAAVLAVRRTAGAMSLANAFVRPVDPARDGGVVDQSVGRLLTEFTTLEGMYGDGSAAPMLLVAGDAGQEIPVAAHLDELLAHVAGDV